MKFIYKEWDNICRELYRNGYISNTAESIINRSMIFQDQFITLKHDVETNPKKALELARIESNYGHKGSYYIQVYLLYRKRNLSILKEIQKLGHEVSYHHDVMDYSKGNIEDANKIFSENLKLFQNNGFPIKTICQHGNPMVKRVGYTSNRDFFRNDNIRSKYKDIFDIMVNYRDNINENYKYISDAGYN